MIDIDELKKNLSSYERAKKDANEVRELVKKSTAKGHSDGKWYSTGISFNQQVAYQAKVGSNNYHNSDALNKEMIRLINKDIDAYRQIAIENIFGNENIAITEFEKYTGA